MNPEIKGAVTIMGGERVGAASTALYCKDANNVMFAFIVGDSHKNQGINELMEKIPYMNVLAFRDMLREQKTS